MIQTTLDRPQSDREPFISLVLYRLFKWSTVIPIFRLYFRGKVYRSRQFIEKGPVIVVANHAHDFDPFMAGATFGRPVAFMAKQELFKVPGLGKFISLYGAYPVRRGTIDRSALRAAMERLRDGWAVGVFLDGTRTADGRIHDPKLGAAFLAAHSQARLVPVSIWGSHRISKPGSPLLRSVPVSIRIGEPIDPPPSTSREDLEAVTEICTQAVHALHDLGR